MTAIHSQSHSHRSLSLQLIERLASKSVSLDLDRTNEQRWLQISPEHICLAGLALLDCERECEGVRERDGCDLKSPSQLDTHTGLPKKENILQQFQDYCRHYNSHNPDPIHVQLSILPALSPRVIPTEEQLTQIRQHLALLAQESLEAILLRETTGTATGTASEDPLTRKAKNPKAKPSTARVKKLHRTPENPAVPSPRSSHADQISLVDLIQTRLGVVECDDPRETGKCTHDDDDEWIPIPPKLKRRHRHNEVEEQQQQQNIHLELSGERNVGTGITTNRLVSPPLDLLDRSNDESDCSCTFDSACVESTTTAKENSEARPRSADFVTATSKESHDRNHEENQHHVAALTAVSATSEGLQEEIERLTLALKEANELLRQERIHHAQQLSQEKEHHANSMQALQLRLYISETRLKTYEEALDEHIQSVASNVYQPTSPPRPLPAFTTGNISSTADGPHMASPLISRVMQTYHQREYD